MKNNPLVSIVLCTYNGENFLEEQLASLVAQKYQPLEIITVDDCSTDSTPIILRRYKEKYDFFKLYFNKSNLGYCKNFEKALRLCSGDYIAFCDQDDIWLPQKIETFVREIKNYSLVYSMPSYINDVGSPIKPPRPFLKLPSGRCPLGLLFAFPITGHLSMIKRDVLKYALPFPDVIQEHDYWVPIIAAAMEGLKPIEQVLSYYRIHDKNTSMRKRKKHRNPIKQIQMRRDHIHTRLKKRISILECVYNLSILSAAEHELVEKLLLETKKLPSCFMNIKLKKIIEENKALLLPYCKKPNKQASRLSKGIWYFRSIIYLNRT